jgi:hypothetical protein
MSLRRVIKVFAFVGLILLGNAAYPTTALALSANTAAQPSSSTAPPEGINLQISPLPIELKTKPGTAINTDLRVRNAGSSLERLQVRLLSVSEDDNGQVHLTNPKATDEYTKWVSFDRPVFEAPAGAWQTIKMSINVPKSAAFGYYFAVEYLRASDVAPQPGKAVAHGAVATFILLNADAPGAKREAQVVSFSADRKSYEFLPTAFSVKVKSSGNVHVAPYGNIFIGKGSKQVGSVSVNGDKGNVLPKGSRFFSSSWSDGFPVYVTKSNPDGSPLLNKKGQPQTSLKWDFSKANRLRFGKYTAHLVMVYDNGQRDVPMEATVGFWVVPWRVLAALLVIGLFMLVGLWSSFGKISRLFRKLRGKKT